MSLDTPVTFIIFNRPSLTQKVFDVISQVQPKNLFVIADGPRNEDETSLCKEARAVIQKIDWNCNLRTNYSEINLGCRRRISSGLDWVFSQVEEAIILEDDCLPSQSFFYFCQELLSYYQNDERVWVVSGDNFQNGKIRGDGSYYFSRYPHCWGWATWKRAWQNYQDDLVKWPEVKSSGLLESVFDNPKEVIYWTNIFNNLVLKGKPDSWAYRWAYTCWLNSGLTVLPNINLVSNIGFGEASTHTKDASNPLANLARSELKNLTHPSFMVRHKNADKYTFNTHFGGGDLKKNAAAIGQIRKKLFIAKKWVTQNFREF